MVKHLLFITQLILIICINSSSLIGQKKYKSVVYKPQLGYIIPTNEFVKGENNSNDQMRLFQSNSFHMLWQTPDSSKWKQVYQAPYYGAGAMISNYFNQDEVGVPISLFGILGIPITRLEKLEIYSELQFGMAYGWQPYDSINNPNNVALGGRFTVHISAGFNLLYPISKSLDLGLGTNLLHFSNGGIERPNKGMNIFTTSLDLKYHLNGRAPTREIANPGKLDRTHYIFVMANVGIHQLYNLPNNDEHYPAYGLSIFYFSHIANAFRLGYGSDINYWNYQQKYFEKTTGQAISIGLSLAPEVIIGDLILAGAVGIYAKNADHGNFQKLYQRLGLRYDFTPHLSSGIHVRSINFGQAELLEFSIGSKIY